MIELKDFTVTSEVFWVEDEVEDNGELITVISEWEVPDVEELQRKEELEYRNRTIDIIEQVKNDIESQEYEDEYGIRRFEAALTRGNQYAMLSNLLQVDKNLLEVISLMLGTLEEMFLQGMPNISIMCDENKTDEFQFKIKDIVNEYLGTNKTLYPTINRLTLQIKEKEEKENES